MLNEEQIRTLIGAINNALPKDEVLHAITMVPRVGCDDMEAKPLMAFVLAQSPEDFERFKQILSRGQSEYQKEYGYSAAALRQIDLHESRAAPPVIDGLRMVGENGSPEVDTAEIPRFTVEGTHLMHGSTILGRRLRSMLERLNEEERRAMMEWVKAQPREANRSVDPRMWPGWFKAFVWSRSPFNKDSQRERYDALVSDLRSSVDLAGQQAARIAAMIPGDGDLSAVRGAIRIAELEAGVEFTG